MTVILTRHGWSTAPHMTGVYGLSSSWLCVLAGNKEHPRALFLAPLRLQKEGWGGASGAKGRASESGKTIPKELQTAKSNTATRKPWPASSENN